MSDNLIERLRVQKTVDEMTPDELDKADFIYGHEMCVLDGRLAADRITALIAAGDRLAQFARHDFGCAYEQKWWRKNRPCSCRYIDALKAWRKETGHE
jgi:hypothetical protein